MEDKPEKTELGKQVAKTALGVALGTILGKAIAALARLAGTRGGGC